MAGEGVERGSAELSRSTRRHVTWPLMGESQQVGVRAERSDWS